MKNIAIIVLAVLLVAAIIPGFLFYGKYVDMKDARRVSNKELLDLNERIAQLNKERSKLYDQIKKNAEGLKELQGARLQISQLEDAIKVKDQALSGLDEKIGKLEDGIKELKSTEDALRKELSSKGDMVTKLQEQLKGQKAMVRTKMEELKSTYDSLILDLKKQLKNKEMTIGEFKEKLSISFVDRVLFDFGEASITPEGRSILTRVGEILKNVHGMQIRVVGHTDNIPIRREYLYKFPSNWELSSARAAAVVRYFQRESGIDPKSLEVVGRSFYRPVTSNETEEARAQNRRVEIIIAPKIEK